MSDWFRRIVTKVIRLNGVEQINQPALNFVAGQGLSLDVQNREAEGETRVTFSAAAAGQGGSWSPVLDTLSGADPLTTQATAALYVQTGRIVSGAVRIETVSTGSANPLSPLGITFSLPVLGYGSSVPFVGGVTAYFSSASEEESYGISDVVRGPSVANGVALYRATRWTGGDTPLELNIWFWYELPAAS